MSGDEFVELELTVLVHLQHPWDVAARARLTEQGALDALLEERELEGRYADLLVLVADGGHHHGAGLADRGEAWATCSVLRTPVVTTAASAPWPSVTERAKSAASSIVAKLCVAPISRADSRLNSTGSTAMTLLAPAWLAPCTALIPTPPIP